MLMIIWPMAIGDVRNKKKVNENSLKQQILDCTHNRKEKGIFWIIYIEANDWRERDFWNGKDYLMKNVGFFRTFLSTKTFPAQSLI